MEAEPVPATAEEATTGSSNAHEEDGPLDLSSGSSSSASGIQSGSSSRFNSADEDSACPAETKVQKSRKRKHHEAGTSSKKRRREKKEGDDESSSSSESGEEGEASADKATNPKKSRKPRTMRKNIRGVLAEDQLQETTKTAQQEEAERLRRIQDQQKARLEQVLMDQLRERHNLMYQQLQQRLVHSNSSLIHTISSSSDENDVARAKQAPLTTLSSDSDVKVLSGGEDFEDEEDEPVEEDPNNSGMHVNDELNVPDEAGRVLVNIAHSKEDQDVYLAPQLARSVKPHQVGGIRFLYDNIIESLSRFDQSQGFGCILAHSMGLGKTLQVISFSDVFLRNTSARHILCIVPINTIQNWLAEYNHWLPAAGQPSAIYDSGEVRPREFSIHVLNDTLKNLEQRGKVILQWQKEGGVLLMGYELYRQLANKKPRKRKTNKKGPLCIDLEEEDKTKSLLDEIQTALVNPGPDLVICDEGHRIKNCHASISQALKSISTKRRVVLTGYPLQNNLMEYWCMVDFVRPNFLGTKTEFSNMFERPIQNGQCVDSTPKDVRLMRHRAHVLHQQLKGFVQRRGHQVLQESLPRKEEHVLLVRMTTFQRKLYKRFMEELIFNRCISNPLKAFAVCCKIWNHPDVLYNFLRKKEAAEDLDLELEELAPSGATSGTVTPTKAKAKKAQNTFDPSQLTAQMLSNIGPGFMPPPTKKDEINYDWAAGMFNDYVPGQIENSTKLEIFLSLLEESLAVGDRMLLFSQSLFTLNLIEEFLSQRTVPHRNNERWANGKNYFRLDGSTAAMERERLINTFNADPSVALFMVSTRAGSLGINLVGANRVVVYDASWNPCHDTQAVCRVYRYGQTKPSYVYRLVTDNCLEKKIYDRQVNKQGMSDRVVDELNPDAHLHSKDIHSLICDNEDDPPEAHVGDVIIKDENTTYDDPVLDRVIHRCGRSLTKEPFTHESLLIDRKESKLTRAEKRLAERSYQLEKGSKISYTRPSYAAFYPKSGQTATNLNNPGSNGFTRNRYIDDRYTAWKPQYNANHGNSSGGSTFVGRPVASVRPMQTELASRLVGAEGVPLPPALIQQYQQQQQAATNMMNNQPQQQPQQPQQQQLPESQIPAAALAAAAAAGGAGGPKFPVEALARQGVAIQNLVVPKDVMIPTNSPEAPPISLKKGQEVMVIRTPKGIYLRMGEKIIKIRLPPGLFSSPNQSPSQEVVTLGSSDSDTDLKPPSPARELFNMVAAATRGRGESPENQETTSQ